MQYSKLNVASATIVNDCAIHAANKAQFMPNILPFDNSRATRFV